MGSVESFSCDRTHSCSRRMREPSPLTLQLLPPHQNDRAGIETSLNQMDWQNGDGQLQAFSDGSCAQELSRQMKKASWALFPQSEKKAKYCMTIAENLRQSSAATELASLELAIVVPRRISPQHQRSQVDQVAPTRTVCCLRRGSARDPPKRPR